MGHTNKRHVGKICTSLLRWRSLHGHTSGPNCLSPRKTTTACAQFHPPTLRVRPDSTCTTFPIAGVRRPRRLPAPRPMDRPSTWWIPRRKSPRHRSPRPKGRSRDGGGRGSGPRRPRGGRPLRGVIPLLLRRRARGSRPWWSLLHRVRLHAFHLPDPFHRSVAVPVSSVLSWFSSIVTVLELTDLCTDSTVLELWRG